MSPGRDANQRAQRRRMTSKLKYKRVKNGKAVMPSDNSSSSEEDIISSSQLSLDRSSVDYSKYMDKASPEPDEVATEASDSEFSAEGSASNDEDVRVVEKNETAGSKCAAKVAEAINRTGSNVLGQASALVAAATPRRRNIIAATAIETIPSTSKMSGTPTSSSAVQASMKRERSCSGFSFIAPKALRLTNGYVGDPKEIEYWTIGGRRNLGNYQLPLLLAYDEMINENKRKFRPIAAYADYQVKQPHGTMTGIKGVSGAFVGIIKMAIALFPDVPNAAIASRLRMPTSAFTAVEQSLLLKMGRAEKARNAVLKGWRCGLTDNERSELEWAIDTDNFNPLKMANDVNMSIYGFLFEWVFTYDRPFLFRPHHLQLSEQPGEFGGEVLDDADGYGIETCGLVFARSGTLYDVDGVEISNSSITRYRLPAF